jgi:hypothetical protein
MKGIFIILLIKKVNMKGYSVCTLFEKDYHLGLAVFVNSLFRYGFKGTVWAGYKGTLPPWANSGTLLPNGIFEMNVNKDIVIKFIGLNTDKHLTNYKPDFMIDIFEKYDPECGGLYYFDPDIVIKNRWSVFEDWIQWGVLMCEDVNSPVNKNHPLRKLWIDCFNKYNIQLISNKDSYINGGFIGIMRSDLFFLNHWKKIQDLMSEEIGGLKDWGLKDRTFLFSMTDQDALNIAIMNDTPVSILGREGMDIIPGGYMMSHAIGSFKPWRNKYLKNAINGIGPSMTDKLFWKDSDTLLKPYSNVHVLLKRMSIAMAVLITRFIKR